MLGYGVDATNVRNVVFFTAVRSTTRFKQMIGRGTRLDEDRGKEFFSVIDFTGVMALFADPSFDGPPVRVVDTTTDSDADIDEVEVIVDDDDRRDDRTQPGDGLETERPEVTPPIQPPLPEPGDGTTIVDPDTIDQVQRRGTRHVLSGIDVTMLGVYVYVVEPGDSYTLRAMRIESWARERILDMGYDAGSLRRQWANAASRRALLSALDQRIPMSLEELATSLGFPDAEPLDLLLRLAFDQPVRSRADRAAQFSRTERTFLDGFAPEAREIVERILDKYVQFGPAELEPSVLLVPPFDQLGTVTEIAERFGGARAFRDALDEVNRRLYATS